MIYKHRTDHVNIQDIILTEDKIYARYQKFIDEFKKSFYTYECEIKLIRFWTHGKSKTVTSIRPACEHNYASYVCYQVLYNGKPVIYDDENSSLEKSYIVLSIYKTMNLKGKGFIIKVYDDIEDFKEELKEDLNTVKQLGNQGTLGNHNQ